VTEVEALRLRQGQTVRIGRTAHQQGPGSDRIVVLATDRGRPVALAAVEPQAAGDALLRSVRVLNL